MDRESQMHWTAFCPGGKPRGNRLWVFGPNGGWTIPRCADCDCHDKADTEDAHEHAGNGFRESIDPHFVFAPRRTVYAQAA